MFKINKALKPGHCAATRCPIQQTKTAGEPLATHDELTDVRWADGREIELCPRHLEAFRAEPAPAPVGSMVTSSDALVPVSVAFPPVQYEIAPGPTMDIVQPIQTATQETLDFLDVNKIVLTCNAQYEAAGATLLGVKRHANELEKLRTSVTKPMLEAKRAVDGWFKPAKDLLKTVEDRLKGMLLSYTTQQEAERLRLLHANKHTEALAVEQPELPTGISRRESWTWKVVDASLIPNEYMTLDKVKVSFAVNANKGLTAIPGIEVWDEGSLAVRS